MRVLRARNVNGLFYEGMHLLDECGERVPSRAGDTLTAPFPVMSVYECPMERVLFDSVRDANPFFHLMEGLWMLAGRQDSAFLDRYVASFGQRFAEPDGTIHDAYGYRWRRAMGFDQLESIVHKLRANPADRQCVLQMWDGNVHYDCLTLKDIGHNDLDGKWRGRPCNTHAYFRVRERVATTEESGQLVLDMTVCCRSNDAVWGAHGANAVHFSMLQEYLAGRVGIGIGQLYQLSNNYHAYVDEVNRIGDPVSLAGNDPYEDAEVYPVAMAKDWSVWDEDLRKFMRWHDWLWSQTSEFTDISVGVANQPTNQWFLDVAVRAVQARWLWKMNRKGEARVIAEQITAPDWRRACVEWMERRAK